MGGRRRLVWWVDDRSARDRGESMWARQGDRLVIKSGQVGERPRDGQVLEVRGKHGEPPYLVRWSDDGRIALVYPGTDAIVEHGSRAAA
jgi:hypothetical protein